MDVETQVPVFDKFGLWEILLQLIEASVQLPAHVPGDHDEAWAVDRASEVISALSADPGADAVMTRLAVPTERANGA